MTKQWWKSKTLMFGLALEVLGVIEMNFEALHQFMSAKVFGVFCIAVGLAVKVLRFATTQGLVAKDA